MTHDEPRLEEEAISKAAKMQLSGKLDAAEDIDVKVKTDLLEMVQGQADTVDIAGEGLVMQKDIRVESMKMHADNVAINPLNALFGEIQLNHPIDAATELVLTEQDVNRAFNSDYMRSKMQKWELNVEGKTATIEPKQLEMHLPTDGKVIFSINAVLQDEIGKTQQIRFTATMLVKIGDRPLLMEGFNCSPGQGISIEFAIAFMQKLKEIVNLPYFELEGMALQVKDVDVKQGKLKLYTIAHVNQLPS